MEGPLAHLLDFADKAYVKAHTTRHEILKDMLKIDIASVIT